MSEFCQSCSDSSISRLSYTLIQPNKKENQDGSQGKFKEERGYISRIIYKCVLFLLEIAPFLLIVIDGEFSVGSRKWILAVLFIVKQALKSFIPSWKYIINER